MQRLDIINRVDQDGNLVGGRVDGIGLAVSWQDGPLLNGVQTGALVTDLLAASLSRLYAFQDTRLSCWEVHKAITHIEEAVHWLEDRVRRIEDWPSAPTPTAPLTGWNG